MRHSIPILILIALIGLSFAGCEVFLPGKGGIGQECLDPDGPEGGVCREGTCIAGFCRDVAGDCVEGKTCDDLDPCTSNDLCTNAVCSGSPVDGDEDLHPAMEVEGQTCTGGTDCDDSDPAINPAASEDCSDGIDNDCDGDVDAADSDCSGCVDGDGDLYGEGCAPGPDCDDNDPAVNPGVPEGPVGDATCSDGKDNDCDGNVDGAQLNCIPCEDNDECDDTEPCNGAEICTAQGCTEGNPVDCDDRDPCTLDGCNPLDGSCDHGQLNDGAACEDGDPCTDNTSCQGGDCTGGSPKDCSDGNPCTQDLCLAGGCISQPLADGALCDDGDGCTVGENCLAEVCRGGTPRVCDDDNVCTDDSCDAGACVNDPVQDGSGCDDGNQCTDDSCQAGACTGVEHDRSCDDGDVCTTSDFCEGGVCLSGDPDDCDDLNPCTNDTCDPALGGCQHSNILGDCDDGDPCTMDETCTGAVCAGVPMDGDGDTYVSSTCGGADCDDSDTTINPGVFEGPAGSPACNDGDDNNCDGNIDNADVGCQGCVIDSDDCDDGNVCNGDETCPAGQCVAGTTLTCSDSNPCTTDDCNPASGCTFTDNTAVCDDGDLCNGIETCGGGSCNPGTPVDCDDGIFCTTDSCDPGGSCQYVVTPGFCLITGLCFGQDDRNPLNSCQVCDHASAAFSWTELSDFSLCDNGDNCTVNDFCTAGVCTAGPPLTCTDNNPCTNDSCVPATGACQFIPAGDGTGCDDGDPCTWDDKCSTGNCIGLPRDEDGDGYLSSALCPDGRDCCDSGTEGGPGCTTANARFIHPGRPEGPPGNLICLDGTDNDCDWAVDNADPDCKAICNSEGWCWAHPLPQGNPLNDVWISPSGKIWMVGDAGTILTSDGAEFSQIPYWDDTRLNAVWGVNDSEVYIVGDDNTALRWNGNTLISYNVESPGVDLLDVHGSDMTNLWAVGTGESVFKFSPIGGTFSEWTTGQANFDHFAVWVVSNNEIWAAGSGPDLFRVDPAGIDISLGKPAGCTGTTRGLYHDGEHMIAVGDGPSICYQEDPLSQYWVSENTDVTQDLLSIEGRGLSVIAAVGKNGSLVQREAAGFWASVTVPTNLDLRGIWLDPSGNGWAVGDHGVMIENMSGPWIDRSSRLTSDHLYTIHGVDPADLWAVGDNGTALHYEGGGWIATNTGQPGEWIPDVWGASRDDVWAIDEDGVFLRWDGFGWTTYTHTATQAPYHVLFGLPDGQAFAASRDGLVISWDNNTWMNENTEGGSYLGGYAFALDDAWIVGQGGLALHRRDPVDPTWTAEESTTGEDLTAVWGANPTLVWAVGVDQTIVRYNGINWQTEPTGTPWPDPILRSVWGPDPSEAWAVGDDGTLMNYNGTEWRDIPSGTNLNLNGIWVSPGGTAWAVGEAGTILVRP